MKKCEHRWKTMVKGRAWKCRKCGEVHTKSGAPTSLGALRDLMPRRKG